MLFQMVKPLAKGHSSQVFLVKHTPSGRLLALKKEHARNRRLRAIEKEVYHLRDANAIGIGPQLYAYDPDHRCVIMEYLDGVPLSTFILDEFHSSSVIHDVLSQLLNQCRALDAAGIDHGQLAGPVRNIMVVRKNRTFVPVIIDFEKASQTRQCRNVRQVKGFLLTNPRGKISRVLREQLGTAAISQMLK